MSAAARFHPALGRPFLTARGEGAWLWDVDGRRYLDLETSFGATLLGHGDPRIRAAVEEALDLGVLCGHDTPFQTRLAHRLTDLVPSAELVGFTSSGTETTWHAARIARAATGRSVVSSSSRATSTASRFARLQLLAGSADQAGDAAHPAVRPESAGIPDAEREAIRVLPWNELPALESAFAAEPGRIAAVVIGPPVNIDAGTIWPLPGYLAAVRDLAQANGALLDLDGTTHRVPDQHRRRPGGAGVTPV